MTKAQDAIPVLGLLRTSINLESFGKSNETLSTGEFTPKPNLILGQRKKPGFTCCVEAIFMPLCL